MKVVFLEDVQNVAGAGEIKEVADGYGRNFLIPRKLAVLADASASQIAEVQLKKKARKQAQFETEMMELAKQVEGKEIILKARTGAKDRLYGSITSADISSELGSSIGAVVDKRKIELDEPIRELGSYEIAIRLTKDIAPKIKLTVAEEEEKKEAAAEEKKTRKVTKKAEKKVTEKVEEKKTKKAEEKKTKKAEEKKTKKAEKKEEAQ
ncbi:50S ribosomal protein L9 [Chloroflexota bacterium]